MFGAISEKFRTFDIQIIFAIPPNFSLFSVVGGIFFPFSKLRNFYHFINQFVRKVENFLGISRQSLFYSFFINIDINIDFKNEVSVRQQDEILKMLFEKIRNDVAFKEFVEVGNNDLIGANKDLINAYVSFSTSYRAVCQEYNIIPIDYAFPTYQDMIPCQFLKTVLDAWKIAIKMLYTLRIIPEIKEVIDNLKTYDEILAIAENETDDKLQLLLVEVVDIAIETDNVLNENYKIWQSFENREDNALVERINNYIGILNTCMKENKFENYKTEDITQFYPQKSRDAKIDGVDDFDKLLDNFLSY